MSEAADRLRALFPEAVIEPPKTPGAYLLLIALEQGLSCTIRKRTFTLTPGTYAYCGSAKGPGGIAARVARHLRRDKQPHWHIDQLTMAAHAISVLAFPGGSECALVARLTGGSGASIPVAGFGSSDCRHCPAHLLRL